MADCTKEFNKLLAKIELGPTKIENLKRGRDALRDKIRFFYSKQGKICPLFCGQGSFRMKTTIVQKEEDYDLDDGVYIMDLPPDKNDWPKTEIVHNIIFEAVKSHTDTPPENKKACIRVQYKRDYHIDLAIYGTSNGKYYLARKGEEQWEENDPKLFNDWFLEKRRKYGEDFRTIIKLIKKWAYYNGFQEEISGFLVTILVGNNYTAVNNRIDCTLTSTLGAIVRDLSYNRKIVRPVVPYKIMTQKYSSDDFQTKFLNRFISFHEKAQRATTTSSIQEACDIWMSLFGDDFPNYEDQNSDFSQKPFNITRETHPWGK